MFLCVSDPNVAYSVNQLKTHRHRYLIKLFLFLIKQVFVGVSDPNTGHSVNQLKDPIITKVVRVNPQQWTSQVALSFDVLGCVLKGKKQQVISRHLQAVGGPLSCA